MADRARADGRARRVRAQPPEAAGARRRGRCLDKRGPAPGWVRPLAARPRDRAGRHRDRNRVGALARVRGRALARAERARRLAPLLGAVLRAGRRLPRRGAASLGPGPRLGRGGGHLRLGAVGRRGGDQHRRRPFRSLRAGAARARGARRDHGRGRRRRPPAQLT